MEHLKVGSKNVYVVQSHHQVLEAWEVVPLCNVFTLDYHTDTKEAFGTYAYWRADSEVKAGKCNDRGGRKEELIQEKLRGYRKKRLSIQSINANLRHDEHIDFAVRTGIASKVFVLAHSQNEGSSNPRVFQTHHSAFYENQPIVEYSAPDGSADNALSDQVLKEAILKAEAMVTNFFDRFILDIDCDYFNTEESLSPESLAVFSRLITQAEIITIAREAECVRICRRKGCELTSDSILKKLLNLITNI